MKLTKRLEAEILEVMEDYWSSYLNGDLQRWASYLPDDYRNIGTTKEEIWNNKKEIVDYTNRVIDQMVGMAETRNKKTQFIPYDPYVMVHELGDLYVKAGESWIYYAQFRMSSLLEKTADGWKILHQHGSFPDSKADEGEAFGFDELKVENKKLRDAIQSRTMELERKNRELEIEAALERVRAASMSMHTPDELKRVGEIIFAELKSLGFANLRNTEIIINNDKKESVLSHYYSDYGVSGSIEVFYDDHPVVKDWAQDMKKASDAFAEVVISEDEIDAWKKYREEIGYLPDPKLDTAKSLYYYSYSTGLGALSVSSFTPITEEQLNMLARFRNVFGLAYRRYVDVAQAEAQAREAQIQLALERVRARTMAMQKSEELPEAANTLFQQVQSLGMPAWSAGYCTWNEDKSSVTLWMSSEGVLQPPFSAPTTEDELFIEMRKGSEQGKTLHVVEMGGTKLVKHYQYMRTLPVVGNILDSIIEAGHPLPTFQIMHQAYFSKGFLLFITYEPVPESHDIFIRFAKVFEQTYTRFLDLQKAEAQAREAQIEAALERVRSRSMAMHHSDELVETSDVMFDELKKLEIDTLRIGICTIDGKTGAAEIWSRSEIKGRVKNRIVGVVPLGVHPVFDNMVKAWKAKKTFFSSERVGDEVKEYYEKLTPYLSYPLTRKFNERETVTTFFFAEGSLNVVSLQPLKEEECDIMIRFARVFGQIYRRFLDLKRAEAQAREGQIEAALERVRSRTMAMHQSAELGDVAAELFAQMNQLVTDLWTCGFVLCEKDRDEDEWWLSMDTGFTLGFFLPNVGDFTHATLYEGWLKGDTFRSVQLEGEALQEHYEWLMDIEVSRKIFEEMDAAGLERPDWQKLHAAYFSRGYLVLITREPCDEEEIFKRFAQVFDLIYTRFLDLKNAEEQAREAQIELSLERIRAQVTAMKESADLLDIVVTMRTEFVNLGHEAHYFWHMRWLPDRYEKAMTSGDGSRIGMVMTLPRHIHGDIEPVADWERSDEPTYVLAMDTETAVDYVDKMITLGDFEQVDPQAPSLDDVRHIGGLTFIMARTTHGEIGYSLPGVVPDPTKDAVDTLVRFAGVFDLAYKRFEDLQKAEARAREAEQQASLDRVRAEIASMRTTGDLQRITPLIWRELTTLGVPFFRCGVFIIEEAAEQAHVYLSTPAGEAVAALHLKFDSAPVIQAAVQHWRQQQVYREEWNREQFIAWTQSLVVLRQIDSPEKYQAGGEAPEKLALHFLPFTQGMLYIGSRAALSDDEIELGRTLAKAFGMAYARYEDFQKLEAAKVEVEVALENLKKTQGQLIQAEKMASLGQLTAGIAHEIRNPLNFVNNFATLSMKVLQELAGLVEKQKERIEAGDAEEIDEEIGRLRELNKKINEHGKRAGNIVSSMMEHARSGKGERTATDINLLLDESANLVYHGMRATDPSFNVTIEKEYDESIGKLKIVPQDISRVFLNLVNNACYAAFQKQKANGKEKKTNDGSTELAEVKEQKASGDSFSPTISLSTKNLRDRIEIRIRDNGNGIPKDIREKIFNPFFTTKPTGQGTGLGLSISYDIVVQEHEGEIRVETEDGKFTEFVVRLPRNG